MSSQQPDHYPLDELKITILIKLIKFLNINISKFLNLIKSVFTVLMMIYDPTTNYKYVYKQSSLNYEMIPLFL